MCNGGCSSSILIKSVRFITVHYQGQPELIGLKGRDELGWCAHVVSEANAVFEALSVSFEAFTCLWGLACRLTRNLYSTLCLCPPFAAQSDFDAYDKLLLVDRYRHTSPPAVCI